MRDRLIELLKTPVVKQCISQDMNWEQLVDAVYGSIADCLLANGVIVPPCKVGDTVYDIFDGTAYATRVLHFVYFGDYWACRTVSSFPTVGEFGERIFLTKEEAEQVLKEREQSGC